MYVCMYVCMYVRMYVCMYVHMYVCVYVCAHITFPAVKMYKCTDVHTSHLLIVQEVHVHLTLQDAHSACYSFRAVSVASSTCSH